MTTIFRITLFMLVLSHNAIAAIQNPNRDTVDFIHYDANLTPSLTEQRLDGSVEIQFAARKPGVRTLVFSSKYKEIKKISSGQLKLEHNVSDDQLTIMLPKPLILDRLYRLKIQYSAKPERGMRFYPDHLFTVYHTANWLVSHSNLADKASFELRLTHDKTLTSVGNGSLISQTQIDDKRVRSHWSQPNAIPLYTFGFALGKFQRQSEQIGHSKLHYLYRPAGQSELSEQNIRTIYQDAADMVQFFEQKSGFSLPSPDYHYIMVKGRMAQEASGFSLVGEAFGHALLEDPHENWFVAHELAHEWWGNSITCASFSHFWLNEGLVQFLVAAYKEHRFGAEAYIKEIELAVSRVKRAVAKGRSAPVAFRHKIQESEINRTMTYSKGAMIFHLLRQQLGDRIFWQTLRQYSQTHRGGSVTTQDLQTAFEQASGTDLSGFFTRWVYGEEIPSLTFSSGK